MNIKQAFTLIELLVVIAIIGILSGLIVVSMGGMTQKATIAKAQVFSNSLRNSLMLNLISDWKLDQVNYPSTDQTPDVWGPNNGTLKETGYSGACSASYCPQLQTSNCVSGNCFYFDGVNDYIDFGEGVNNQFDFGGNDFTVVAWINPKASANWKAVVAKGASSDTDANTPFVVWFHGASNKPYFYIGNGTTQQSLTIGGMIPVDQWTFLTFTVNSSVLKSYVNGSFDLSVAKTINPIANDLSIAIGKIVGRGASYHFLGAIDEVRIYNAVLPTSKIKEHYYAGLNSLLAGGSISTSDYQKRLLLTANK